MDKLTSELSKYMSPEEIKDVRAISEYMIEFLNYILFQSEVQDEYKHVHVGFKETLKNQAIWGNYANLCLMGQPKIMLPTDISKVDKVSDYFTNEHAEIFSKYVMTMNKLLNLPSYQKILKLAMTNGAQMK